MSADRIGLIQVDGSLPNLALMQIGAFYGSRAAWCPGELFYDQFDKLFASKIFSFSGFNPPINCAVGGTGVDFTNRLPDEMAACDPGNAWFLYPEFKAHLGFSMKGCRFRCEFCCVPQKEGRPWANASIGDLLTNPNGGDRLILLDNDFFGGPGWRDNLLEIQSRKLKVNFSQGLNIRIITDEQAAVLAAVRFVNKSFKARQVNFAWDRFDDERFIKNGIERCVNAGIKPYQMRFFVLVGYDTTEEQDLYRIEYLRSLGCDPFVMPYDKSDLYQNRLARWVNHAALFNSTAWKDYRKPTTNAQLEKLNRADTEERLFV